MIPNISADAKWIQDGVTVAGGNGWGNELNQLARPLCMYVDENQTVYVADHFNQRIVEWKNGVVSGRVVAGGNDRGNRDDQLDGPLKVIVDKEKDSLIIADYYNKRVVRWPRQNGSRGEILISNIRCYGLAMDRDGNLYVSDCLKHEVRRWKIGETEGIVVAGGNGEGDRLDQLNFPNHIFVDQDYSVYVSDQNNYRVMKWKKDAKEGIVVAGGQRPGNTLIQFLDPHGIIVDQLGTVYVVDDHNNRIMRWLKGATEGSIVVGRNNEEVQFNSPCDLSFDQQGNLYVLDYGNQRVQKFHLSSSS